MTIEDRIKDEKLRYDINREAAKISALSSGKIDKYEYFTGEEILPSNQQQIIEQTKFTYSPLGKAFEKQTKTIEDQGKKQVDALVALKPKNDVKVKLDKTKTIKDQGKKQIDALESLKPKNDSKVKLDKTPSISNNYFKDRLDEIKKCYEPIDEDDLDIYDNTKSYYISFDSYKDPITLFYDIKNDIIALKDAKDLQKSFKKRIKNLKYHDFSNSEKYKIDNIKNLYKSRTDVIKIFDDYNLMQKSEGLKILTPNQMLKRLPIALA